MRDDKCRIHFDAMGDIYMMAVLNLKTARDKCSPPIKDPQRDMFLLEKPYHIMPGYHVVYKDMR